MKIAFIIPKNGSADDSSFYDYKFYSKFLLSKKYISYLLAIPTLAALTPSKHDIRIFDENIEKIDYTWKADVAAISVRTMFAKRAYKISDQYRRLGVKTILGGIHPSMCPDEALQYCDSIVIGEAEDNWGPLLKDVEDGNLKRIYRSDNFADLKIHSVPDRSSLSAHMYLSDILQTAKGCPFHCEFCSVHAFDGQTIRTKTVEQVLKEIEYINSTSSSYKKKKAIFFADDNIIANKQFAMELFTTLTPYKINWMCQASINISEEDDILRAMRKSGCGAIFIGFESLSKDNLGGMHKNINSRYNYLEAVKKIQSHGILVHGSFILGYDFDWKASFDEIIEFIQKANLLMPLINILTPFPGTKLFSRFEAEGRILHKDWSKYDSKHVVFTPRNMSIDELQEGYKRVVTSIYSFDSIYKRLKKYWDMDFWKYSNEHDPIKFKYQLLFAIRLCSLLVSTNIPRSKFILKILPRVFNARTRISTLLALMAYNDFAYSLKGSKYSHAGIRHKD